MTDACGHVVELSGGAGPVGPALRIRESGFPSDDEDSGGGTSQAGFAEGRVMGESPAPLSPGRTRVTGSVAVVFATG